MKKVLILLIVLAALIGVAFLVSDRSDQQFKPVATREKLITAADGKSAFDVNAVKKIRIKEDDKAVTVALTGDAWTVAERSNYPAAFDKISKVLLELRALKTAGQRTMGKAAWGRVKLKAPGDGKKEETGLQVELLGEGDKALHTLVLGSTQTSNTVGKEASPYNMGGGGRYVRVSGDGDTTVWVVSDEFYDLVTRAEDWIDKSFIAVTKLKAVEVTAPKAEDSWSASRKDEAGDFALDNAKDGEAFDTSKASLNSLLANGNVTDVLSKDKATPEFMKDATKVKLTTFENFTYNLQVLKKTVDGAEKAYITVAVTADLPKERPPVKDEKPEDKKKADDAFAATKKTQEEKLANEKKVEGWVFEVGSYVVDALLKKRSEVLKDKPKDEPKKDATIPGTPGAPPISITPPPAPTAAAAPKPKSAPITVTTPPVSVQPAKDPTPANAPATPTPPKPELKAPPASPIPETPKAPPAPAKADAPKAEEKKADDKK